MSLLQKKTKVEDISHDSLFTEKPHPLTLLRKKMRKLLKPRFPKLPKLAGDEKIMAWEEMENASKEDEFTKKNFLLRLAKALHASGAPVHRTEYQMTFAAQALGILGMFAVLPNMLIISFGDEEGRDPSKSESHIYKVFQDLNCERMFLVSELAEKVGNKKLNARQADKLLTVIQSQSPFCPIWVKILCFGISSGCISPLFFKGGWLDMIIAGLLGALLGILNFFGSKFVFFGRILEPACAAIVAFIARILVIYISPYHQICFFSITLSAIVWFLPGLSLTIAISELATHNMISGATRMFGAVLTALELSYGLTLGARLVFWDLSDIQSVACAASSISPWWNIAFFVGTSFPFIVLLDAHPHQWTPMFIASLTGYIASYFGESYFQGDIATALAAFVVGVTGSIYSRFTHHPALVCILAGILLQVPGSLGVRGFSAFIANDVLSGTATTFQMVYSGLSITVGLFLANLIVYARHALTPDNVIF